MDELLTLNDAAEYLGVSRMKLWRLVKDGTLTAVENPLDNREKLIGKFEMDKLKARAPRRGNQPVTERLTGMLTKEELKTAVEDGDREIALGQGISFGQIESRLAHLIATEFEERAVS